MMAHGIARTAPPGGSTIGKLTRNGTALTVTRDTNLAFFYFGRRGAQPPGLDTRFSRDWFSEIVVGQTPPAAATALVDAFTKKQQNGDTTYLLSSDYDCTRSSTETRLVGTGDDSRTWRALIVDEVESNPPRVVNEIWLYPESVDLRKFDDLRTMMTLGSADGTTIPSKSIDVDHLIVQIGL
jgi:hypothetical protein